MVLSVSPTCLSFMSVSYFWIQFSTCDSTLNFFCNKQILIITILYFLKVTQSFGSHWTFVSDYQLKNVFIFLKAVWANHNSNLILHSWIKIVYLRSQLLWEWGKHYIYLTILTKTFLIQRLWALMIKRVIGVATLD